MDNRNKLELNKFSKSFIAFNIQMKYWSKQRN